MRIVDRLRAALSQAGGRRATPWVIAAAGLMGQLVALGLQGIRLGADSRSYVDCWAFIAQHGWPVFSETTSLRPYYYIGYCSAGAALTKVGMSVPQIFSTLVVLQAVATGLIPWMLFMALRRAGPTAALGGALLAFLVPDLYRWTPYILSDAFYIAGMAALLGLLGIVLERRQGGVALFASAGIVVCCLLRPPGMILMGLLGIALLGLQRLRWRGGREPVRVPRSLALPAAVLCVPMALYWIWFFGVVRAHTSNVGDDLRTLNHRGVIIHSRDEYSVGPPSTDQGWPAIRHAAVVALERLYYYFRPNYPHHSLRHQLINLGIFIPLYLLALWALWKGTTGDGVLRDLQWLALLVIGYHAAVSVATFVEPDHRFLAPVFPVVIYLAAHAVSPLPYRRDRG